MEALLWVAAGVALLLVEIFTLTVAAGMVGAGALVAALAAAVGAPVAAQVGVFAAVSAGLLVVAREPVQRALGARATGADIDPRELSGKVAVVVQRVSDNTGQVRLSGELWRARPWSGTGPIDVGASVTVAAVEGATVLVYAPDQLGLPVPPLEET